MIGASQHRLRARLLLLASVSIAAAVGAAAQDLEPRAYAPAPVGTTFVISGFGRSQGPILVDPSLDVDNVQADLWVAVPGGGHVFPLAGRQARILVVAPIAWGAVEGELAGARQRQHLTGLVDPRIRLSVGLRGAPALDVNAFVRTPRARTSMGVSVTVVPPLGQYESTQLVNLGYNRWAVKPEFGVSQHRARWTVELYAGLWMFGTNKAYFPGDAIKRQEGVFAAQAHVSYTLPRSTWIAFDGTWFTGGQTQVDRVSSPDEQRNTRLGVTYSFPLRASQSLKFVYSTGASTRRGSSFNTFNVTWQVISLRTR